MPLFRSLSELVKTQSRLGVSDAQAVQGHVLTRVYVH